MYEFVGSKSAKLVVQKIREISSPDYSVNCFACSCEYYNKSSHIARWFCCLLHIKITIRGEGSQKSLGFDGRPSFKKSY
jgi:hypothetical protein